MTEDLFDGRRCLTRLRERGVALGQPLRVLPVTASTNDDAMRAAAEGAASGTTFVAERQTQGRGRRGRSWSSQPGSSLTFSLLLRPELELSRIVVLPLLVGLAVRHAVACATGCAACVKWPNDVVVGRLKVAGILVESRAEVGDSAVVVGVGVNVGASAVPAELAETATSLEQLREGRRSSVEERGNAPFERAEREASREELLVAILEDFESRLARFRWTGLASCLDELRAHDALLGCTIVVEGRRGVARGIDEGGALLLETSTGIERVVSGTVTW